MALSAVLASVVASLGVVVDARAADQATPDKDLQSAKDAFESAQVAFVRGEYPDAAEKFLAAYQQKPFAAFLFNVAVSYEKAKQLEKAKLYFEKYLEQDPNATDAAQVKLRLDGSTSCWRRRRRPRRAAAGDPAGDPARGRGAPGGCPPGRDAARGRAPGGDTPDGDPARRTARRAAAGHAGAPRDRHQRAGGHRLEAAGGDDLSQ